MSQDAAQLARRWFEEVWNQQRDETIRELARAQLLDAFPDMRVAVEDMIAQGENVVVRWRANATHIGAAMDLKPSQRAVSFRGMTWMLFRDGRMIEGWDAWNQGALLQSLQS